MEADGLRPAALVSAAVAVAALWFFRSTLPLDVLAELTLPWLAAGCITLGALGAGYPLTRALLGRAAGPLPLAVVLGAGAAVLALVPVALASYGLLRPAPLIGIFLAAAVSGIIVVASHRPGLGFPSFRMARGTWLLVLLLAAVAGLTLSAPPAMYDSLNYHLAFPAHYLRHGGFVEFPRDIYSYYPASEGMLFTYMLVTVGAWGAKVVHWWMALVAALAAAELAKRLGGDRAAAWAAVLFFAAPPVLIMSGMASNDLAVAAWAGGAFVVIGTRELWRRHPARAGLVTGILLGTAAAAKYLALATAVIPGGLMLLGILLHERRRAGMKGAALIAGGSLAGFLLTAGPWFLRNALWTGNPVYPYFEWLFHHTAAVSIGGELSQCGPIPTTALGWVGRVLAAPIARTFVPLQLGGTLGVQFLIFLPAAAVLSWKRRELTPLLWIGLGAGTIAWGLLVTFARFATPELVLAAALAGWAMAALTSPGAGRLLRRAFLALAVFIVAWNVTYMTNRFSMDRLLVVTGARTSESFLDHWVSYWPAARWIDAHVPPGAKIMLVGEARSFGIDRDVVVEDPFRTPLIVELANASSSLGALENRLGSLGITHLLVNPIEMRRIARQRGLPDYWAEATPTARRLIGELLSTGVDHLFEAPDGAWVGRLRITIPPPRPAVHPLLPAPSGVLLQSAQGAAEECHPPLRTSALSAVQSIGPPRSRIWMGRQDLEAALFLSFVR
ncbi:MAG: hypothetical protein GXP48_10880 [Acidobacteria bacterium]|nr:hypothetical protein [Acidobacteriota bacterium]